MFISIQTLNAIKQQWIINGDIIYPPKTWCDFSPQTSKPGVPAFWREKLVTSPICHQHSGQMSLFFTGSQQDRLSHFIMAVWGRVEALHCMPL